MPFSRFSEYFLAVAATGSLRKAAEVLFISVSAVHRQINLTESAWGVQLFERHTHGLKLTAAGELLYADLKKWHKEFQRTQHKFDEIQGLNRGCIQFGIIAALSDGVMVDAIQALLQQYPWINFQIKTGSSEVIRQQIMQNELDFGLLFDPIENAQLSIHAQIEMPIGVVVSPEHAFAKCTRLSLSDTIDERHIVASSPLMIHDKVSRLYQKHQLSVLQQIDSNDIQLISTMLKRNLGISILSYLDVYPQLQRQELIFIPLQDKSITAFNLALCSDPRRQLSQAARVMMQVVEAHLIKLMDAYPCITVGTDLA